MSGEPAPAALSFEWLAPPFDVVRVAHVELIVTDLAAARAFYVDMLGLVPTAESGDAIYLRGYEERLHHSLVLRAGPEPLLDHIAYRVRSASDLDALATFYEALGCKVERAEGVEAGQGPAIRTHDPLGFPIEFFHEMEQADCLLQRYDAYRGARITRADHVNLYLPDVTEGYELYRRLGFRCSEYIADDRDGRAVAVWLYRKQTVHDVALTTGHGPRMHHFAFTTAETAAITGFCDILAGLGREAVIERGPGRHGVSNAFFVYLRDPDGHRIELYTGDYYTGDPDHRPLRWSVSDARRRTFWGHHVPDSWYDEGSLVRARDGGPAPLRDPVLDERLVTVE
jgi:3,4-dihydroxyphenylacetate 2,3-dioxygenase